MKTNKKTKIILDIVMTLLLVLMCNKMVLGLAFHEIGGLCLIFLFIIHNIYNWNWTKGATKGLLKNKLSKKAVFSYFINFLLALSLLMIAISGILISKTIFTDISSNNIIWKGIHIGTGALAVILIGVHIGLHWNSVVKRIAIFKKLALIKKILISSILVFIILTGGFFSLQQTNFIRNLYLPFIMISKNWSGSESSIKNENREVHDNYGENTDDKPNQARKRQRPPITISNVVTVILKYLSILSIFILMTYYGCNFFNFINKRNRVYPLLDETLK